MVISLNDRIELALAWCEALDYKIDIHIELIKTKDPVKRIKLINRYKKSERVCNRLVKLLCQPN